MLCLLAWGFAEHAWRLGADGLAGRVEGSRLVHRDRPLATAAVFSHMLAGAALSVLAPLQLIGAVRRRWPAAHRWTGRATAPLALFCAAAGGVYILSAGTVGGLWMDLGFGTYGALLGLSAVRAWQAARARRFAQHREWALRLVVLALGSWLYRVHYGLWELATGGLGRADDFTGAFDRVQVWAFFLPYLAALEWRFRRERRRGRAAAAGSERQA
ncbi:MAG: DUF2306 domain-containing protein [Pseudomonadota bacterium]